MRGEMGTDDDDRVLGIRKERELNGPKVDSIPEANESGVSSEAAMPETRIGM